MEDRRSIAGRFGYSLLFATGWYAALTALVASLLLTRAADGGDRAAGPSHCDAGFEFDCLNSGEKLTVFVLVHAVALLAALVAAPAATFLTCLAMAPWVRWSALSGTVGAAVGWGVAALAAVVVVRTGAAAFG